jgi:carboxymethylenebutenolidase
MAQTVSVGVGESSMGLYDAEPDGVARGAVVVLQEGFGVTEHIEDVCRRFAAEGYRAVAPHLFHRSGDPVIPYDDLAKCGPPVRELTAEGLEADLEATRSYLFAAGFDAARVAVVGFCMGGSVAFLAAARGPWGAAVSFYGGGVAQGRFGIPALVDLAAELKTPWLGLYGDEDPSIPVEQVESLRDAAGRATVTAEIVRYPEADHGFHCDARGSYHETSAKDAWNRTLQWLDGNLAKS